MKKSEFNTTREQIIEPIINLFPPMGGMNPQDNSPQLIRQTFKDLGEQIEVAGPDILKALETTAESARQAGLNITVNNVRRAVRALLNIWKINAIDEMNKPLFPQLYKGVSFNPKTSNESGENQEWLMILDFFAMMRSLQKEFGKQNDKQEPIKFAIFDAGLYWMVNLLGKEGIKTTASTPEQAAREILDQLLTAVQNSKYDSTYKTALARNAYLESIAEQFPANMRPPIFNLLDIWNEPGFEEYLAKALQLFCERDETGKWQVKNPIKYERYIPYSPWVTPLVAAEQGIMSKRCGFSSNLAPTSEVAWNTIIDRMCRELNVPPYVIWGYVRSIAEDLPYESIPTFSDTQEIVGEKLGSSRSIRSKLPELIGRLVAPFLDETNGQKLIKSSSDNNIQKTAEIIASFTSEIERKANAVLGKTKKLPQKSLANTGWLMAFPPGTC
ncbi:hypothetical protein HZC21_04445 [Candidatus Peregrinibacteria bacterium]|nr:hypothetical protein [Candidatus Peregrinibacteria bacterium]